VLQCAVRERVKHGRLNKQHWLDYADVKYEVPIDDNISLFYFLIADEYMWATLAGLG